MNQTLFQSSNPIHPDLLAIQNLVYLPSQFKFSNPTQQAESAEYGACVFQLNELHVLFRVAKITPTKIGQFVTLWKRFGTGPIQPYDLSDSVDLFVVSTRKKDHFGQFVFPKSVLFEQGVLSEKGKGGKRAIRVYPPWDKTTSSQAKKTQQWQLKYFLEIPQDKRVDLARSQLLHKP